MLVGNPSVFAIESNISKAYERLSYRALGYFVLYISNHLFGIRSNDATMLACSFDAVDRRLSRQGLHCSTFGVKESARAIVEAVRTTYYADDISSLTFFDMSSDDFNHVLTSNEILWAPDGDEAFDDGTHILQFDIGNQVRLIAFINHVSAEETFDSVVEVTLGAEEFYNTLRQWKDLFENERGSLLGKSDFKS